MSLDVSLIADEAHPRSGSGIFIRDAGSTREITRFEWDARCPGQEPVTAKYPTSETHEVYAGNITHNLREMAHAAGLYEAVWRPDNNDLTHARDLIGPLSAGLVTLRADPGKFAQLAPDNGWGTYDGLLRFVGEYLNACVTYPDARVEVSR